MTRRGKRRQFLPGSRKQLHTHGPWQPLSHPRTSSRLDYGLARGKSQPCPDTCYCQAECQPWVWLRGAQTSLSFLPNRWCLVNPQEPPVSPVSAFRKCEKFGGPEEKVPQVGLAHSAPTVAQPPDYHHLQQLQSLKYSAPLPVAAPLPGYPQCSVHTPQGKPRHQLYAELPTTLPQDYNSAFPAAPGPRHAALGMPRRTMLSSLSGWAPACCQEQRDGSRHSPRNTVQKTN